MSVYDQWLAGLSPTQEESYQQAPLQCTLH